MNIVIHSFEDSEPVMLAACTERVRRFLSDPVDDCARDADIYCNKPERDGFTEYLLVTRNNGSCSFTIGAIRRAGSDVVEFHS